MLYVLLAIAIVAVILIFLMPPPRARNERVESGGGKVKEKLG